MKVTKDIDLKELFNVIQSKQRSLNELKTHYDSLVSFEEVNENFLSQKGRIPHGNAVKHEPQFNYKFEKIPSLEEKLQRKVTLMESLL